MLKKLLIPAAFLLISCTATAPNDQAMSSSDHSDHGSESSMTATASMNRLSDSPRHQEWVEIQNNGKTIYAWVVYPQTSEKRPVVLLIHENKGLNDWARSMADQVAEAGYIAVAPDLLSGFSDTTKRTSDFATPDDATKAISQLKPDAVSSDLQAVTTWTKSIPASNGKLVSAGFCWGGSQSFQLASTNKDLAAALVFYGTGPTDKATYSKISTPVFGFYGGADARVNATIDQSKQYMADSDKKYDYKIYEGAGHAFMRLGEDPAGEPANIVARTAAWERMKEILSTL
ncbi:MAG: dienelactone hydrolase family protein [Candidatus Peribacteraceae bacterium]|nr:dienelactone hydrolase family protein [Candidatus Peribacteraceae bacterium]